MNVNTTYPDKQNLYICLRCIDRIILHLKNKGMSIPQRIETFLNDVWDELKGKPGKLSLLEDQEVEELIIDEQDATDAQLLTNRLYFAISDLILFLNESNPLSTASVQEEALEMFRHEATTDFLVSLGANAVVLQASEEAHIEADPRIGAEKAHQRDDKNQALTINDWSKVLR
jgi:hypothetical protein